MTAPERARRLSPSLVFGLALTVLLAVAAIAVWSTIVQGELARSVTHTHDVLATLDGVTIALLQAETGRRGFSIMPDEQQLGSLQAGIAAYEKALLRLRSLVADAGQRHRLDALDPQCAGLIAYMRIGVELERQRPGDESLRRERAEHRKALLDRIWAALDEMREVEHQLLGERTRRAQRSLRLSWALYGAGFALGVLLLVATFLGLAREASERARAEQELSKFFTLALDLLAIVGLDGRFKRVNPAWENVLGLPLDSLREAPYIDFVHPDDREATNAEAAKLADGVTTIAFTNRYRHRDGSYRVISWNVQPDLEGGLLYAAARDITVERRLQEELRERIQDVTRANRELEAFSYSVSHDLRAPLRGIDGFSQAILEDYGDRLDATGKDYLQRIRRGVLKMAELTDALLGLARVTRAELRREPVDLSALAGKTIERLRQGDPGRIVDVAIEDGLVAEGDPRLLGTCLENLLGNAWKFTARRPDARIELASDGTRDGRRVFFVRDNGAGFDPRYKDKLFGAFQRLHGQADFPGTGVGLATVQRVIHRHGGEVWADGAVDGGATFSFSL